MLSEAPFSIPELNRWSEAERIRYLVPIPPALVERVEVLTGGASAVYGADAVTGVVNFILRDDFEGLQIDGNVGMSEYGDAQQNALSIVWGQNFDNDRGNITFAYDMRIDDGLKRGERGDGLAIGSSRDWVNPALRFQQGDIGSATPNFAEYYNYANTSQTNFGLPIPTPTREDLISEYTERLRIAPGLTSAESALFEQAANAPQPRFPRQSPWPHDLPGRHLSPVAARQNGMSIT